MIQVGACVLSENQQILLQTVMLEHNAFLNFGADLSFRPF